MRKKCAFQVIPIVENTGVVVGTGLAVLIIVFNAKLGGQIGAQRESATGELRGPETEHRPSR